MKLLMDKIGSIALETPFQMVDGLKRKKLDKSRIFRFTKE